jgi:5-methylcytosine-specific restriction protein A
MGVAWQKLYSSARWQRRRRLQLLDHPLCKFCLERGVVTPAIVADHLEPHRGDVNLFYTGELMSLCKACHDSRKRFMEINGYAPDISLDGWPIDPLHPVNRVK